MDSDALIRDIEMIYEMLFAFLELHGGEDGCDEPAAWAAAREQVREAINQAVVGHTQTGSR